MDNNLSLSRTSKSAKVPYMGCQSLMYQNRISRETDSHTLSPPISPNVSPIKLSICTVAAATPVETAVLIQQHSPQSIRSFSTFRSDRTICNEYNTVPRRQDSDRSLTIDQNIRPVNIIESSHESETIYDTPPTESRNGTIDRHFINTNHQSTIRVRKKHSFLHRTKKASIDNVDAANNAILLLCAGMKTPHSALNKSLDSLPEAEHLKANLQPIRSQNASTKVNGSNSAAVTVRLQRQFTPNELADITWTKHGLKKPILDYIPKNHWRLCLSCFKTIQKYMGDRKTHKSPTKLIEIIQESVSKDTMLCDEVLLQICRQTIHNPDICSHSRGVELLSECLGGKRTVPSSKMQSYLISYLQLQLDRTEANCQSETGQHSAVSRSLVAGLQQCRQQLLALQQQQKSGFQRGSGGVSNWLTSHQQQHYRQRSLSIVPSLPATRNAIQMKHSFFNQSLESQMQMQQARFHGDEVPLILSTLTNQISDCLDLFPNFMELYNESCFDKAAVINAAADIDQWCISMCANQVRPVPNLQTVGLCVLIHWFQCLPQPPIPLSVVTSSPSSSNPLISLSSASQAIIFHTVHFIREKVILTSKDSAPNMASFLCSLLCQFPPEDFYPLCNSSAQIPVQDAILSILLQSPSRPSDL